MHYVKYFNINGVDTKQVACIELQGAPNAATEGAVGVLGMDVTSPTHEVYRCVAVNGSVYTWQLLSAGMSVLSATITREGAMSTSFDYANLKIPNNYLIRVGDLILDIDGYLYQVSSIGGESCDATYCGTHLGGAGTGDKDYRLVLNNDGKLQLVTENGNVVSEVDLLASDDSTFVGALRDVFYPIGFTVVSDISPAATVGGTWEQVAQGRTLVGAGSAITENSDNAFGSVNNNGYGFVAGSTGGQFKRKIKNGELPKYAIRYAANGSGAAQNVSRVEPATTSMATGTGAWMDGVWQAKLYGMDADAYQEYSDNMQPYLVAPMWKRIA